MRLAALAVVAVLPTFVGCAGSGGQARFGLVVHGGAGSIAPGTMTPEVEAGSRQALEEALRAGHAVLRDGGASIDAVQRAIEVLEDSPHFNAGRGAVFTSAGVNEFDASIMDGRTLAAGAVGAVRGVKNPIALARLVMERTWHVLLVGEAAGEFAREQGADMRPPEYFHTERRWKQLERARERERGRREAGRAHAPADAGTELTGDRDVFGTVGAVALDRAGNLAAGTSTGGLTNKRPGRVGDSPIIGAGTYARNATCAISGTGQGEYFMRSLVAYEISARMEHGGLSLTEAAASVVEEKLTALGGRGGVIGIDRDGGTIALFNTGGMFRGTIDADGRVDVKIYGE